jgi:hypothetical protein
VLERVARDGDLFAPLVQETESTTNAKPKTKATTKAKAKTKTKS